MTALLFKQHFKQNANDEIDNNAPLGSDEIAMSTECSPSSGANMYTNKENTDGNVQYNQKNVPDDECGAINDEAEVFCGMVVQQLTAGDSNDHKEEWHHGQLNAYNWAHEQIFEKK